MEVRHHVARFIFAFGLTFTAAPQATTLTYTQTPGGANTVALGYPVPTPIDSLDPVAGFRSYNSLHAKHVALDSASDWITAHNVGSTINNRSIWAYEFTSTDAFTPEGFIAKGGALINGGIHAREWQSPEVTTAIMERLSENQNDGGYHQYLFEHLRFVVIPILNVDGVLQTQRFPNQVMNSTFSTDPAGWPRDGRMRRKNMRAVDENLITEADNLLGIDLNRNHAPFWASTTRSSSENGSLVYHGSSAGSEPESQALYAAGDLFSAGQLRMYIDMHSFSQLYYVSQTSDTRYNGIAQRLGQTMISAINNGYTLSIDPPNSGIGTTQDRFASSHNVPSYTLEIEPRNSSSQYGGLGVTHDGFILPASEIARVRTELTRATTLALYVQSGPAALVDAQVLDAASQTVVARNHYRATSAQSRTQELSVNALPSANALTQISLTFNKPMRMLTPQGEPMFAVGVSGAMNPTLSIETVDRNGNRSTTPLTLQNPRWQKDSEKNRYDYDTFSADTNWPNIGDATQMVSIIIRVDAEDAAGTRLDAKPATVARFANGVWIGNENTSALEDDLGGIDATFALKSSGLAPVYNGGLSHQSLTVNQALNYQFAQNAFTDPENAALTYIATRTDDSTLPAWLNFNATERRFSGTPTAAENIVVKVTATDPDFNKTSATFNVSVSAPTSPPTSSGGGGGGGALWLLICAPLLLLRLGISFSSRQNIV